jgi:hypothetical protein
LAFLLNDFIAVSFQPDSTSAANLKIFDPPTPLKTGLSQESEGSYFDQTIVIPYIPQVDRE